MNKRNIGILSIAFMLVASAAFMLNGTAKTDLTNPQEQLAFANPDAEFDGKCGDGKCGDGKTTVDKTASKDKTTTKSATLESDISKCGDGKCGDGKAKKDTKASLEDKSKTKKEKCGSGKCGDGK
ncbi:hypothetical protein [Lentimicrobium sp. S6]|uniref:HvfA family oxazolone/thioamide-modified RiPP metallophore n=1 Tax=Lentimicrobium sp. S6 TaxID=2735872 RepID=UPI00155812AE|nr:hypothetical protein [Lentimicrobium sp. S6]NPD45495.1 hypothetical protein [Lentimicrobium sp. S6]